jgi:hypothetical protein
MLRRSGLKQILDKLAARKAIGRRIACPPQILKDGRGRRGRNASPKRTLNGLRRRNAHEKTLPQTQLTMTAHTSPR